MKVENLEITIWDCEDCRDMGITYELSPDDLGIEDFSDIELGVIEDFYECEGIMDRGGSIEVSLNDDNGRWIKTLYHISEDSNHELKVVVIG